MSELLHWLDRLLEATMPHLVAVPILVPMLTAALMLLLGEHRRRTKAALTVVSGLIGLLAALALLRWVNAVDTGTGPGSIGVYLPGNWRAPFGIVLVADRLSTLMVALTGVIAFAVSIYSTSRWDRAGVHFHPLLQLQLMGLNGAFLTGDLFNLFVFFEVMLAASYGLLLHGSGRLRVSAGLHYIAINLAASSLFLVGAALLYGVTGTLNMADLGLRIAKLDAADRGLVHAAAAILATAFFAKAGAWPLNFWLVPAYSAAVAPVSAVFALLTKLGIYTVLRLWTVLFAPDTGASAQFGQEVLLAIGLSTLFVSALGITGTQRLSHLAGYAVLISAGTLLTAIGLGQPAVWAGALYYLLSSTLAASAFFLLIDMIERWRNAGASIAPHEKAGNAPFLSEDLTAIDNVNLDDEQQALYGREIPAGIAFLGLSFVVCTLLLAGLPPLSGFVGKFAMLSALLDTPVISPAKWSFLALLLLSGFLTLVALSRAGIRYFWTQPVSSMPALRALEVLPVAALLAASVALSIEAGPVMQHANAMAQNLFKPAAYRNAVMGARQVPNPPTPKVSP
ncbi:MULTISPECIES: monovalent cation/H+ antiporter subunit D [unclassified Polaromonas]|jgi:multicomponent K+:H+ antiporter subunit D|uniref:monovalent cation/H+ antiporter subunit D n=1 Tax=unclassified Polaromonas TaxID=2638319 RepID=UPI000BCA3321|nr:MULTISPECIES: monovalent cation/H+ antiporter subunit D [unclassified Polaromonas]OYY32877.1 MAG: monovalent cation/H+ antiporter subunit D [Polaromonas sp. 35-63-35]OYZ16288.1 MAG: monovalent cation/H+ antiporter subunit D [Polaromonas sp. 16-63-31]OYZ76335.1 MAG: monovalent cation/H+ antiporter subunit D [Polaromonas sp. 24-63-21]OZA51156.1 MAG: monovalent cation/H+ antiporter subunit D [Polaromonas sp. 17-63-33]OZA86517.1 MAG: monovalent cation/H+ antiporter subunit D [Polaromonas sp. 39